MGCVRVMLSPHAPYDGSQWHPVAKVPVESAATYTMFLVAGVVLEAAHKCHNIS